LTAGGLRALAQSAPAAAACFDGRLCTNRHCTKEEGRNRRPSNGMFLKRNDTGINRLPRPGDSQPTQPRLRRNVATSKVTPPAGPCWPAYLGHRFWGLFDLSLASCSLARLPEAIATPHVDHPPGRFQIAAKSATAATFMVRMTSRSLGR